MCTNSYWSWRLDQFFNNDLLFNNNLFFDNFLNDLRLNPSVIIISVISASSIITEIASIFVYSWLFLEVRVFECTFIKFFISFVFSITIEVLLITILIKVSVVVTPSSSVFSSASTSVIWFSFLSIVLSITTISRIESSLISWALIPIVLIVSILIGALSLTLNYTISPFWFCRLCWELMIGICLGLVFRLIDLFLWWWISIFFLSSFNCYFFYLIFFLCIIIPAAWI